MPRDSRTVYQISGFFLLISTLFLGLSLYSYSPNDPSWNAYMTHGELAVRNYGGAVGANLADWGLQMLGSTAMLLVVIGLLDAWHLMRRHLRHALTVTWRGCLLLAAVSTAAHLAFRDDPFFGAHVVAGGIGGQWLASLCLKYLNPLGTYLAVGAAIVFALCIGVPCWPGREVLWRRMASLQVWPQRIGQTLVAAWQDVRGVPAQFVAMGISLRQPSADELPADMREDLRQTQDRAMGLGSDEIAATPPASRRNGVKEKRIPIAKTPVALDPAPAIDLPRRRAVPRRPLLQGATPSLDLLDVPETPSQTHSTEELEAQARFLEERLRDFGVEGEVVQVLPGPVITMYEYAPASGVKVSKIVNLQDDLALVMRALSVRVVAPIPGKAVVGIEIPSKQRETVRLRSILETTVLPPSSSKLSLALGKDIMGVPVVTDLALLPHLLIAGATGAGKSVGLNCMICTMLFRATPAEVRMIMIDPKMLELSIYEGIPHLLVPVVTNPKKAALALRRVVEEMERRYQLLAAKGVRSIAQYNHAVEEDEKRRTAPGESRGEGDEAAFPLAEKLPYLVVVIDELSDLMMVSSRDVEDALTRIAQMARAAGIHLIVATQRPSVDVLTGVIKANFPARLSFQVTSKIDSRTILDANGAEQLLGRGDMLFLAPGTSKPQRVQSAYVSEEEINRLVDTWKSLEQPHYDDHFLEPVDEHAAVDEQEYDEKYDEAVALVAATGQASISMIQRRLRVGYNRAARMIEIMEREGVVGPADGVKPRDVLVRKAYDSDAT